MVWDSTCSRSTILLSMLTVVNKNKSKWWEQIIFTYYYYYYYHHIISDLLSRILIKQISFIIFYSRSWYWHIYLLYLWSIRSWQTWISKYTELANLNFKVYGVGKLEFRSIPSWQTWISKYTELANVLGEVYGVGKRGRWSIRSWQTW